MKKDKNTILGILQELNKQYDNEPTDQTAQKIIDFVENELEASYELIVEAKEKRENKLGASILSGILMVALVGSFAKTAEVLFITFFVSSIVAFYTLKFVEKENNKTWVYRYYVVLKEKQLEKAKEDKIKNLESKYLSDSSNNEGVENESNNSSSL